jgi:hypothetical protein
MQFHHHHRFARACRRGAQCAVALAAGLAMTAAWSSQIVGVDYRKFPNPPTPRQEPLPTPTAKNTSHPQAKQASQPASAPRR